MVNRDVSVKIAYDSPHTLVILATHICNPRYLRGKNQKDHGSKPARTNSSQDPILKTPNTKKDGGVVQVVEHLPSKCEALSSHQNSATKTEKKLLMIKNESNCLKIIFDFNIIFYFLSFRILEKVD
jgi:hypothetical protein